MEKKLKLVKDHRLCHNCLRTGNSIYSCPSSYRCRFCRKNHHSTLHSSGSSGAYITPATPTTADISTISVDRVTGTTSLGSNVLLGTTSVILESKNGDSIVMRALIDPASEGSFVLCSRITSNACLSFSAAVLPRLTSLLPRREVRNTSWNHFQGRPHADPNFSNPAQIDCIIGAEAYLSLILPGLHQGPAGGSVTQNTRLGWILVGPTETDSTSTDAPAERLCCTSRVVISTELQLFWEIEELCSKSWRSPADEECEDHFRHKHRRDSSGRYVVRLPFRQTPTLGDSRSVALQRLLTLERRLA